jgi:cytochrome c oxidase cbb3-type subunit 3
VTTTTIEDVPAENEATDDGPLMSHAYDGIREYDNPLPGWWRMFFVGTIVFAGFYGLYFHVVHWGKTTDDRYQAQLVSYEARRATRTPGGPAVNEDLLARSAHDDGVVSHGAEIFAAKCAPCHTADGRGQIGPNLTDLYQLHGTTRMDLFNTVQNGAPGTPMIAWAEQLPPADVFAVATFVTTLRGKNLPGKAPQGQPVKPW